MNNLASRTPLQGRNRISTLDGWRGIAILLVLFDHIEFAFHRGYPHPWMQTGQHGVTIFFALSGFLITSRLIEGPIDLKRFYIRRLFRLMPVAWLFLLVLVLLSWSLHTNLTSIKELLACVFFYRNFVGDVGLAGHFWSLSLEEQFYLLWPALLLFAGAKAARYIAAGGAIACAEFRWYFWNHYDNLAHYNQSQVRADALLVGCFAALILADPVIHSAAARWSRYWVMPALIVLIYGIASFHWLPPLFESVAIAALIVSSTLHSNSIMAQLLSSTPLVWLGLVSYSVYVWQALFLFEWPFAIHVALLCIGLPIFVLTSYYCVEKPMTRLGHRLSNKPKPALEGVSV